MRRRHSGDEEEAGINVTPMLDIVFIMLIFFIVTTSFVRETGIDPRRPEAQTAAARERANVLIALSADGEIWMHRRRLELAEVRALVEGARKEVPESSVIIVADERARAGALMDLMDQVRLAGVENVSIAARDPAQGR